MRRHTIILSALLLFCIPCAAQTFPEDLAGDQLPPDFIPIEVEAYISQFYDMSPWSMPDPTGRFWYLGDLRSDKVDRAIVEFTSIATRVCDLEGCIVWNPRPLRGVRRYSLPWEKEALCYLALNETTGQFVSLTINTELDQAMLKQGYMNFIDGHWVYNGNRSIYTWMIYRQTSPVETPMTVRAAGRVR